jgi:pimeloyl-ACP methyl ester carboxylesterase
MLTTIHVDGRPHAVYLKGQGSPPLVFVHGFPLDHSMWRHQLAHFERTRRVIAPDLPGFGQTPLGRESVSIIDFADDLAKLLDTLSLTDRIVLCGLSMGGCIALQFALRHGQRLAGLILCDARAAADTTEAQKLRRDVAIRVINDGPEFLIDTIAARLISKESLEVQPGVHEELAAVIRSSPRDGIANGSLALGSRVDVTDRLGDIDVPTLLIVGEHDVISTPAEMRTIASRLNSVTFVEVAGAGHMAPLESPDVVNAAIEHYLAAILG